MWPVPAKRRISWQEPLLDVADIIPENESPQARINQYQVQDNDLYSNAQPFQWSPQLGSVRGEQYAGLYAEPHPTLPGPQTPNVPTPGAPEQDAASTFYVCAVSAFAMALFIVAVVAAMSLTKARAERHALTTDEEIGEETVSSVDTPAFPLHVPGVAATTAHDNMTDNASRFP